MRGNVKVIKFTAFVSILFLALTYFTTVNMETHMLELNTIWFSNYAEQPLGKSLFLMCMRVFGRS